MSNEEIRNQEQHRRGGQLSENQSQPYQTKIQNKAEQEAILTSGQPSLVQSGGHTHLQEVYKQPQEIHQQSQSTKYPHDHQEVILLPQQQQTIQSHEHEKLHRKDEHLYEKKPHEEYSHEKLHQENQLYGHQSLEKQPPQLYGKSQEHQFQPQQQQQQFHQPEHVELKQTEQPKVQHIQKQVPQPHGPPTTVVYEVYQTQIPSNTVQPQNIQGVQVPSNVVQSQNIHGSQLPGVHMSQGISPQTIHSGMSMSNTWVQPLPDAQGSVVGKSNYTREEAKQDAMSLLKAMKGAGTDKNMVVEISGNRTFAQRQMIVSEYTHIDAREKRDLLQDLKREAGGDLESLLLPLYMMPGEFDARLMEKALKGFRNDVEVLIEILCTRTNKELEDMKFAWKEKIDSKVRLEEKIADETKSLFGSTNFHVLCLRLLEANRPPCATPDANLVRLDTEELYHQLVERNDVNNAKAKFVEVFTERSWAHIGAVVGEFQKISDKWTMEKAISHEFGNSSNTTKALQVMAEFCAQPYDFWAKRLRDAMKGLGTDDSKTVRIVVSRCEVDMNNIVLVFGQRYGDGKNLKSWIEADTSGAYRSLLLYLCGFH
jgi:hypothetical protein